MQETMSFFYALIFGNQYLRNLNNTKVNKRVKYAIYAAMGAVMILMVLQSFSLDPMDYRKYTVLLWLRGFTGVFAIIAFILIGVLVYRVNADYYKDRWKPGSKSER